MTKSPASRPISGKLNNLQISKHAPQGNRLDFVELDLSLENLLNLTLVWTLLNLLAANQVQELGRQDEVTLNSLRSNKNKSQSVAPPPL